MKSTKKLSKIISILLVLIMALPIMLSCENANDTVTTKASENTDNTIASPETTAEPITELTTELPTDPAVRSEPDDHEIISGFRYFIKCFNSGLYLSVDGDFENAGFTQEEYIFDSSQMFVFTKLDDGNYTIRALGTKAAYLDTENGDGERDGALLEATSTPNAEGSHEWIIKRYPNGTYNIGSMISGNVRTIDVSGFSNDPGALVTLWTGGGQNNQKWFLELAADKPEGDE